MATREEILRQIEALATERLDWSGRLADESRLVEDLGLDSLRAMALLVEIENRFRVTIEPVEEASIETVGQLVALVHSKLQAAGLATPGGGSG